MTAHCPWMEPKSTVSNAKKGSLHGLLSSFDHGGFEKLIMLRTYLLPWKMSDSCKSKSDGRVHVCAGDASYCIDHHGHNKPSGNGGSQFWDSVFICYAKSSWTTRHKHQKIGRNCLCHHLLYRLMHANKVTYILDGTLLEYIWNVAFFYIYIYTSLRFYIYEMFGQRYETHAWERLMLPDI